MIGPGALVVVSLVAGTVGVIWVLGMFLSDRRYARAPKPSDSVEYAYLRRRAEARFSVLAPGAMSLAEKERESGGAPGCSPENGAAREFWRRFAGASGLVEEDPAAALEELRLLPSLLERALADVGKDRATKGEPG